MNINYENITLTPILESNLEFLRTWRNDGQLCKYLRDMGYIFKQDQYNWYLKQKEDSNTIALVIYETKDINGQVRSMLQYDHTNSSYKKAKSEPSILCFNVINRIVSF